MINTTSHGTSSTTSGSDTFTPTTTLSRTTSTTSNSTNNMSSKLPGFKHMLPADFTPTEFDFVIGRGRRVRELSGNRRFYSMVAAVAADYVSANREQKSEMLSELLAEIHDRRPQAGFVKQDPETGNWYAVDDLSSRATVAQELRNSQYHNYKSSRQSKVAKRAAIRMVKSNSTSKLPSSSSKPSSSSDLQARLQAEDGHSHLRSAFQATPAMSHGSMPTLPPLQKSSLFQGGSVVEDNNEENGLFPAGLLDCITPTELQAPANAFQQTVQQSLQHDLQRRVSTQWGDNTSSSMSGISSTSSSASGAATSSSRYPEDIFSTLGNAFGGPQQQTSSANSAGPTMWFSEQGDPFMPNPIASSHHASSMMKQEDEDNESPDDLLTSLMTSYTAIQEQQQQQQFQQQQQQFFPSF